MNNDSLIITKKEIIIEKEVEIPSQRIDEIKKNIKINFKYYMKRDITEKELNEYYTNYFRKGMSLFDFMEEKGYKRIVIEQ
jgi:hypothetical protein